MDNVTATLPAYWDGVWLDWDHWDHRDPVQVQCSFYRRLAPTLSAHFRAWRALLAAAVGAGAAAAAVGAAGAVWFPGRGQVKAACGALFAAAAALLLVPLAWTCRHAARPLEEDGAAAAEGKDLRRDWGPALYLGWVSLALMAAGGAYLLTRWPRAGGAEQPARGPGEEMEKMEVERGGGGGGGGEGGGGDHPLSAIHRTTMTSSQYGRMSRPI